MIIKKVFPKIFFFYFLLIALTLHSAVESLYETGTTFFNNKEYKKAMKYYRKAAENNSSDAKFMLGQMYYYGKGVVIDYQKAGKWYSLSAMDGNPGAQFMMGEMYYKGKGIMQDYKQAAKWYSMSAYQGNKNAKDMLSLMQDKNLLGKSGIGYEYYVKGEGKKSNSNQLDINQIYNNEQDSYDNTQPPANEDNENYQNRNDQRNLGKTYYPNQRGSMTEERNIERRNEATEGNQDNLILGVK